ncbi:ABC transporter substrate-binding protein [Yinghuangia aomiensis]
MSTTAHHRRRACAIGGLLALALTATACKGGSQQNANGAASGPPRDGGTMTMLSVADSVTLDPFGANYGGAPGDSARMAALYDPLVYLDPTTGKTVPHIAESLTTDDNGATWTLRIRPGVRFSDGTVFDAAAVKRNWEMHADPGARSLHRAAAAGLRLDTPDALTLRITPPAPNAAFDRTVATDLAYIEAPSALDKGPNTYSSQPIGAGPFTLKSWVRGSKQEFAKNPGYWQKDKGLPHLDNFVVTVMGDADQQFNTLQAGGADITITSSEHLLERGRTKLNAATIAANVGRNITFNLTRALFDDPRARRAIALALDPADMAKTLGDDSTPAKGAFNQQSPFFDPAAAQPAPDKAQAQQLFDELAAAGKPVDFTYLVPQNPGAVKAAEYFASRLRLFRNVTMRVEPLEIGAFVTQIQVKRDFQATTFQDWAVDPEPRMFNAFHSGSAQNYTGWHNPIADEALEAARTTTDQAARKAAYARLQQALATDLPIWVYSESVQGAVYTGKITGVQLCNTGTVLLDRIGLRR